jgi:hypothetical protein
MEMNPEEWENEGLAEDDEELAGYRVEYNIRVVVLVLLLRHSTMY